MQDFSPAVSCYKFKPGFDRLGGVQDSSQLLSDKCKYHYYYRASVGGLNYFFHGCVTCKYGYTDVVDNSYGHLKCRLKVENCSEDGRYYELDHQIWRFATCTKCEGVNMVPFLFMNTRSN